MLTIEQFRNLKIGDKVTHTHTPRNRKRPVSETYFVYRLDPTKGRLSLATRIDTPMVMCFVHDFDDPYLFITD